MRRATQLFGICWLLCLLAACGESHFMTDASYRLRVEQDFQQKKALMPQGELFTILDDASLSTYEQEALEFLYAYMPLADITAFVPASMAFAKVRVSNSLPHSRNTEQIPLKIWDRITPELPRAPLSAPLETLSHTSIKALEGQAESSFTADCMVRDMFVPVSPSGTGNTLSASTLLLLFSRSRAPHRIILRNSVLFIVFCIIHAPLVLIKNKGVFCSRLR